MTLRELKEEPLTAANHFEFKKAALLRNRIKALKRQFDTTSGAAIALPSKATVAVSCRKGKRRK